MNACARIAPNPEPRNPVVVVVDAEQEVAPPEDPEEPRLVFQQQAAEVRERAQVVVRRLRQLSTRAECMAPRAACACQEG